MVIRVNGERCPLIPPILALQAEAVRRREGMVRKFGVAIL